MFSDARAVALRGARVRAAGEICVAVAAARLVRERRKIGEIGLRPKRFCFALLEQTHLDAERPLHRNVCLDGFFIAGSDSDDITCLKETDVRTEHVIRKLEELHAEPCHLRQ